MLNTEYALSKEADEMIAEINNIITRNYTGKIDDFNEKGEKTIFKYGKKFIKVYLKIKKRRKEKYT